VAVAQGLEDVQTVKDVIDDVQLTYDDYMRIVINSETFLISVARVLSIHRPTLLTPVPMAPSHLMGVTNVRGQIFCLVDPGKALGLAKERKEKTNASRFLLLRHSGINLGIWVEEVLDLHSEPSTKTLDNGCYSYELGKIETKHGLISVLNVDELFS